MKIEKMTVNEFVKDFGITPAKAKDLMERLRQIVNYEVKQVIKQADYYIDPVPYADEEWLKKHFGSDVLEKDNEYDDGYTKLYEFGRRNSAVSVFMNFISWHTAHGGHTDAIRACELMGIELGSDQ